MKKTARPHQAEAGVIIDKSNKGIINLPTGTGKSFIQASSIISDIRKQKTPKVYVIVSPRILLANQLLVNIKKDLTIEKIDCQVLMVHSGNTNIEQDVQAEIDYAKIKFRQISCTTSSTEIKKDYERAQRENVPLIISSTYDSLERIKLSKIPIEILHCDEAHYIVSEEHNWVATEFPCNKIFFYTATLKNTTNSGMGMRNVAKFGEILYKKSPLEMIDAGEILRPRMHFVSCDHSPEADEADSIAIVEAFKEHKAILNSGLGAKMLVCTKGSDHLNGIVTNPEIIKLKKRSLSLTIFDISSIFKPRIDGVVVKKEYFLNRLQNLHPHEDAIILHINILTEGIDVPGITGVMIMNNMKTAKFLQSLGRATRLFPLDRDNLYSKSIKPNDLDEMIKPYAYIIIPNYGVFGDDITENIKEMVHELRSYGFIPSEDVIIKQARGKNVPVPLQQLNELDTRKNVFKDFFTVVEHTIESEEEANRIHDIVVNIDNIEDFKNIVATQSYETVKELLASKSIKKLYNEETIVTPFTLIEEMLDALPKEVWNDKDLKWFDVATGRGAYLYAIKQRLMIGLVGVIADSDEREQHIVENMLYGYDIDLRCCEFAKALIDPLKSYSVNIYNKDYLSEENMKKFDVIVGNPPYQEKVNGKTAQAKPLYHKFIEKSIELSNGYVCLITPSKWFGGGMGLDKFRCMMQNRTDIRFIKHEPNEKNWFPDIEINSGVSYALIDKNYNGICYINGIENQLSRYDIIIPDTNVFELVDRIKNNNNIVGLIKTCHFKVDNFIKRKSSYSDGYYKCVFSKMRGGVQYVKSNLIHNQQDINKYKVCIPFASRGNHHVFDNIIILEPGVVPSDTFKVFMFDDETMSANFKNYLNTKFVDFFVRIRKSGRGVNNSIFEWVPLLDFTQEWTDEKLYKHFGLDANEIKLIEEYYKK